MITKIINNDEYKAISKKQIKEVIDFLLHNNQEFAVTANVKGIVFEPALPASILDKLSTFSLFVLSNYTYSTIEINDNYLIFEAGFGKENFGSHVKIPLLAIFQIIIEESILYINSIATSESFVQKEELVKKSMDVFKNNPKNKKLIHE
ncbi:MAG: hypothetical protein WC149_05370 [Arcobacteraceae bacterium]